MAQPDFIPLHRGAARPSIPSRDLQRIFDPRPDLVDVWAESLQADPTPAPLRGAVEFIAAIGLATLVLGVVAWGVLP